ncbi:MAG: GNAT family N-acetyltransferase [Clostridia bacterium]|nr:GNAT family N-acetyltransferase [Clostridia bacterium]
MKIVNIKKNSKFLSEYIELCSYEWGSQKSKLEMQQYVEKKRKSIFIGDKVISILGLVDNNNLIGFISLFKYDGEDRKDLTPWYATMYVKEKHRNRGYSKLLNDAILKEAVKLGYKKVYLKTELNNYYEKFGAKYAGKLNESEKLYYFELIKE